MIFGRRRKATEDPVEAEDTAPRTSAEATEVDAAVGTDAPDPMTPSEQDSTEASSVETRDWVAFDASQDWRAEGPFDISEVDLEADDVKRVDLGVLVVTPRPGMELRLQVAQDSGAVVSAMVLIGQSALELAVFAAPRSGGMWAEIRSDVIEATLARGGSTTEVEGPFGTELRRMVPVRTPKGADGFQPSRTWAVEGPRWLLRGVLYGQAALVEGLNEPADTLHDVFASTVVRRDDQAKAAGDVITMTMPENVSVAPTARDVENGASPSSPPAAPPTTPPAR